MDSNQWLKIKAAASSRVPKGLITGPRLSNIFISNMGDDTECSLRKLWKVW